MKKTIFMLILVLAICMLFAGCSNGGSEEEAAAEEPGGIPTSGEAALTGLGIDALDGSYTGTMTLTKVGVVYDSEDMDEDGNILHYYKPEGKSEWEGESVEVTLEVALQEDEVKIINGEGETAFEVAYDPSTGNWENSKGVFSGTEITSAEFSKIDGKPHVKVVMTSTFENTEVPDGVNETVLELTKAE